MEDPSYLMIHPVCKLAARAHESFVILHKPVNLKRKRKHVQKVGLARRADRKVILGVSARAHETISCSDRSTLKHALVLLEQKQPYKCVFLRI